MRIIGTEYSKFEIALCLVFLVAVILALKDYIKFFRSPTFVLIFKIFRYVFHIACAVGGAFAGAWLGALPCLKSSIPKINDSCQATMIIFGAIGGVVVFGLSFLIYLDGSESTNRTDWRDGKKAIYDVDGNIIGYVDKDEE